MSSQRPYRIGDILAITHPEHIGDLGEVIGFGFMPTTHINIKMLNGKYKDKKYLVSVAFLSHTKEHYLNEFAKCLELK